MKRTFFLTAAIICLLINALTVSCNHSEPKRTTISLNGVWQITRTDSHNEIPSVFTSTTIIPGLVDLASPAIDADGNYQEGVYWHRTTFTIDREYPERIDLRIGKAKYHAKIYLNRKPVGELIYCFSSATVALQPFLNPSGEENELLIAIGTHKQIPDSVIWGYDFEKRSYIPGIYDDVQLILSGVPYIKNIQIVPNIREEKIRILADIDYGDQKDRCTLNYRIRELASEKVIAEGSVSQPDFSVPIPNCKLWSPESPFLYELTLSTTADEKQVRFGMRSFAFDPESGRALLNGKPYFMRGTNVAIFRFFEDPDRGILPWDSNWITSLHQLFKTMYWNSIRYCIGPPPRRWYEITDSLGFLIQNEYPVWTSARPHKFQELYPDVTPDRLANEFRAWIKDHWNHPSVVIWDAQNESVTSVTGEAIKKVRDLDLSNRPWENGYAPPLDESDPLEAHPYLFYRFSQKGKPSANGPLADFFRGSPILPFNSASQRMPPNDGKNYSNPIIINEYAWLWLNRDGSTTTLTDRVYDVVFGENLTKEERLYQYNRHLGMLTEYWRTNRNAAGVLHFCGLAYSRPREPRGQTSDHFIDVRNLVLEPNFVQYVKPAFAPVGVMINFWNQLTTGGADQTIEIHAINDLDNDWHGKITLRLFRDKQILISHENEVSIPALGKKQIPFNLTLPPIKGSYRLEAEIDFRDEPVKSIREFSIE